MIRRTFALLLVAASVGILAAGCGGSSTSTVTASAPTTTASAPTTTSATTTTSGNTGNSGNTGSTNASNPAIAQAVAACKSRIGSASGLSSSVKSKLTQICDQAASGNEQSARKAAAQVCTEIIKATVPQQAQQFALANCPKA